MYLHDIKKHKRIIGIIVLIAGIALMFAAAIAGKVLGPELKSIGIKEFLRQNSNQGSYGFTLFTAGIPIGAGISVIGAAILSDACRKRIWWYACLLILAALVISLVPVVFGTNQSTSFFVIGGIVIMFLFLAFSWFWSRNRHKLDDKSQIAADLKMAGYFFFLLAGWELCGLCGIPYLLTYPGKVQEFGQLPQATAHAKLIFVLLVVGWIFTVIGYMYNNQISLLRRLKELKNKKMNHT